MKKILFLILGCMFVADNSVNAMEQKQQAPTATPRKKLTIVRPQRRAEDAPSPSALVRRSEDAPSVSARTTLQVPDVDPWKTYKTAIYVLTRSGILTKETMFVLAAQYGDLEKVIALLSDPSFHVNMQDFNGKTTLHHAVYSENPEFIRVLLERGANVNMQDNEGNTPLHYAARDCHHLIASLLLGHGAKVDLQNIQGMTPLHWAAYVGSIEVVRMLLDRGANVNMQDNKGNTPLHYAVRLYHLKDRPREKITIAQILLEHGANINMQDIYGKTPLHDAVECNNPFVVKLLLDCGANALLRTIYGVTPLIIALNAGLEEVVRILKNHIDGLCCPICLTPKSEIAILEHTLTPCCHQFICQHDLDSIKARFHQCPLCRSHVGWE